ncbi:MAG TPA: Rho termination factor N-terminal domain-containing protein [Streptosporangiaceae bacterium]|nr:Rho termination factor N-terminal domain-containing protein [Streptosporangiaceae bacterium]
MPQTKTKTSVKDKALYKRLRNLGVSVKESARVANADARTSRKKGSQHSGGATPYADWKVPELRRRAKKAGIKGRSTMNKKQLIKALRTA